MNVVICRGGVGSGKSTYSKTLKEKGYIVVSADDFFMKDGQYNFDSRKLYLAHKICFDNFLNAIEDGFDVCVDNTNSTIQELNKYLLPAKDRGANVKVITFVCSAETSFNRNIHGVPLDVCLKMHNSIMQNLNLPIEWNIYQEVINTESKEV